jgi:putative glutamine amidotransferase
MKNFRTIFGLLLILVIFASCTKQENNKPLRIAISKAIPEQSYQSYINWLHNIDSTIECIDMYGLGIDSALSVLQTCDGFLLTGGEDVNPVWYGKEFDSTKCHAPNNYRDSIDMALIELAMHEELPIMGICRGMQILNVYLGGTLIFDIPSDFDTIVKHRYPGLKGIEHEVNLIKGSFLANPLEELRGQVYSNHHQGIEFAAPSIKVIAYSHDNLPEAMEYKEKQDKPFMLGVQWHPEKMESSNPLSGKIAALFISKIKENQN